MDFSGYKRSVEQIPFGKRLPSALYVYLDANTFFGEQLDALLKHLANTFAVDRTHNILKFRLDELKVSFLAYPSFFDDPHPALRHAITIDLPTGKVRHTDYSNNINPPILHRKETFLPTDHPRRSEFESLTKAEEQAGLYEKTATIGFKLNWEQLLAAKGLTIKDHTLCRREAAIPESAQCPQLVARHKTALTRYELSKPVKSLVEYGLLRTGTTVFDYGCGQGSDVRGLQALGYQVDGWDPVHRPDVGKQAADVVNLGYVLNVIENPAERLEVLVDAYRHSTRLLVVSALINETVDTESAAPYHDGILTKRNTFQKYFEQQELGQYIEDALETTAVPVALGVFYVFRNPSDQQDFLSARSRRSIDWSQISARLGLGGPRTLWKALYEENKDLLDGFGQLALKLGRFPVSAEFGHMTALCERLGSPQRALRAFVQGGGAKGVDWKDVRMQFGIGQPQKRRWELLYEEHRELLEAFWNLMLQLGRLPEAEEFPELAELRDKIGSPKQAQRLFIQKGGGEEIRQSAENRRRDLLVYVALANLRKRVPFGHLSQSLRSDIRAFFGNYTRALEEGIGLLYAAGDRGEIELACEGLKVGWQDEQALYVHRTLLPELPPVLRAYVGCATALYGGVEQADLIKLHKASGKVTFLTYDDFNGKRLPELQQRTKVNLRTRWVQVFDHSADGQILYYKERFLPPQDPAAQTMQEFSVKLRKLGITEQIVSSPTKAKFAALLDEHGLNENLNKRRGRQPSG